MTVPLYTPPPLDFDEATGSLDKIVSPVGENAANGFTIVGNSADTSSESHKLRVHAALFDILSRNTEIDHPLCDECCNTLTTLLNSELDEVTSECEQYQDFLNK